MSPIDRFTCRHCGWTWEGPCVPHEPSPGYTNEVIGRHQWVVHGSVADTSTDFTFAHVIWQEALTP